VFISTVNALERWRRRNRSGADPERTLIDKEVWIVIGRGRGGILIRQRHAKHHVETGRLLGEI
jgi:hypothetical protein